MRLYELDQKPLKDKQQQKLNNVTYTWNAASGRWMDPRGVQAGGGASVELMKAVGRDPQGRPLPPGPRGVIGKAKAAFDRAIGGSLGGAIDPKASLLGKGLGRVGAALGRGIAKAIAPKGAAQPAEPAQPAQPATPNASGAQGAMTGNAAVQNMNNYVKGVAAELNKPGVDKVALTKELVNFMADRKGTPEWQNATDSVKAVLKRAGIDKGFANNAWKRIQAGQAFESLQIAFINQLLEAVGLTFGDLGLQATLVESDQSKYYVVEDSNIATLKKLAGI
jgi:hypothetical protein